jgi:hypothetical protein
MRRAQRLELAANRVIRGRCLGGTRVHMEMHLFRRGEQRIVAATV